MKHLVTLAVTAAAALTLAGGAFAEAMSRPPANYGWTSIGVKANTWNGLHAKSTSWSGLRPLSSASWNRPQQ